MMPRSQEFAGALDAAPDAILVIEADTGRVVHSNRQAETTFGYTRDQLTAMYVEDLMPPRFRERHVEHRRLFAMNPKLRPMGTTLEIYGLRRNGEEVAVDASLAPMTGQDGMPYVVVALRDISSRKETAKTIDAALYQVTALRQDAESLKESVREYAEITRRGLLKASYRGVLIVIGAVILSITLLGLLNQPWTCEAENLSHQRGSFHYKACSVIFPQTPGSVTKIIKAREAAEATRAENQKLIDLRERNVEVLERVEKLLQEGAGG